MDTQGGEAGPSTHPELAFFNRLSGKLKIELDTRPERIGDRIVRVELQADVFNYETEEFRPLTQEELVATAFEGEIIRLRNSDCEESVSHDAPNGSFFTVQQLLQVVEETERRTRDQSEWLGGIDLHHVYFEGLHLGEDGVWEISWGS